MNSSVNNSQTIKWYRREDGAVAGVCGGLADALELPVGVIRLAFIVVTLLGGSGVIAYLVLAVALPRRDRQSSASESKILGVCISLSKTLEIEIGLVRVLALIALLCSFGLAFFAYLAAYFFLPNSPQNVKNIN